MAIPLSPLPAAAAGTDPCNDRLTTDIPARPRGAEPGSATVRSMLDLSGGARDRAVEAQLVGGNLPGFLRRLTPVQMSGAPDGRDLAVTICVMPDYLSVGDDGDYVRVPLGLPAAADIAERFGFLLPTTRMVDAIYAQAPVRLAPRPMPPTSQMSSTDYFWRHNQTVAQQRAASDTRPGLLTAGQKKDIVLSNRLRRAHGKVAIYGWHRPNGKPIQPLSTVHGASYADYSHGVRLVSTTAFVNGQPRSLARLLEDPGFAGLLSSEGPIPAPGKLLASLR